MNVLNESSGASALYVPSVLERARRDVHAAVKHVVLN
jgi:Acyl-CoA dehydrogenase, C-terminal domain